MQQIYFGNNELRDDTLLYNSLYRNPSFYLVHKVKKTSKKLLFHVEMPAEHDTIQVKGDPSQITVHHLKKHLKKIRGIPVRFQRLSIDNQNLTDDKTSLAGNGVTNHTILSLDLTINSIVTLVVNYNIKTATIKLSPRATIGELMERLNEEFHIPVRDQKLLILPTRKELSPNHHSILRAFPNYQNDETLNATIELIVLASGFKNDIQIIYSDREEVDKITVDICATIKVIKKIISEKSHIQMHNMQLCADGKVIDKENIDWARTGIAKKQLVFVYHTNPEGFLINIRLLNDDSFKIQFPGYTTIELFKRFVEYRTGITAEEQRLFYRTTELDNSNELLRQWAERIIDVMRYEETFIFLQCNDIGLDYKVVPIEVKPNDIIGIIKAKAEKKLTKCLEQYHLWQNKKLLDIFDNLSLFFSTGDIFDIHSSKTPIHYIYVQPLMLLERMPLKRIPVELKKLMTVKDVHQAILMYLSLSEDQQRLSFQDHLLDDKSQFLEYYGIIQDSVLQLIHIISLRIVMTNDCLFSVTIDQYSSIIKLKSIICNKGFAVSTEEQKLVYFGVKLENDMSIKQCRLENNSMILLLIENSENSSDTSLNYARLDRFATRREQIWAERLGYEDNPDDHSSVTSSDDNENDDNSIATNADNDCSGDSDDNDVENVHDDDSNGSDDNDKQNHSSDDDEFNNQSKKIILLYKDDDDDTDDSMPETVCYRVEQK